MQRLIPFLEHLVSLFVVFLMLAAVAAWTGHLFGRPFAAEAAEAAARQGGAAAPAQLKAPTAAEMAALGLAGAELTPLDSASWRTSGGETLVSSAPLAREVSGFAGSTPVFVLFDASGRLSALVAAENAETADYFKKSEQSVFAAYAGRPTAEAALAVRPDAVSGATYSSVALAANVQAAVAKYAAVESKASAAPAAGWGKTAAVAGVLAFGLLVAWRYRGVKWLRVAVHVLNIGVLGYYTGQFLSLSLLRGWVAQGVDALLVLPVLIILALVVLLPFVGRRRHYCTWVCPYGSAQELAAMLPVPKLKCSQKVYKAMRYVRLYAFALLMLLLWTGIGNEAGLLAYEPFGLFAPSTAPAAVPVAAGVFLLAGCFVPHLWCRSLCPLGQLLDLSEESAPKKK